MILVTGGAGFIGSNFILGWLARSGEPVLNLDKLTYAGNPRNLANVAGDARHVLVRGDIGDRALLAKLLREHKPRAVLNFAAESHVDRSIDGPGEFIQTNVVGTFHLLEEVRGYWQGLAEPERGRFRFLPSPPTRYTVRSARTIRPSRSPRPMRRTAPTRHPRLPPTTWSAPTITRTACRP